MNKCREHYPCADYNKEQMLSNTPIARVSKHSVQVKNHTTSAWARFDSYCLAQPRLFPLFVRVWQITVCPCWGKLSARRWVLQDALRKSSVQVCSVVLWRRLLPPSAFWTWSVPPLPGFHPLLTPPAARVRGGWPLVRCESPCPNLCCGNRSTCRGVYCPSHSSWCKVQRSSFSDHTEACIEKRSFFPAVCFLKNKKQREGRGTKTKNAALKHMRM